MFELVKNLKNGKGDVVVVSTSNITLVVLFGDTKNDYYLQATKENMSYYDIVEEVGEIEKSTDGVLDATDLKNLLMLITSKRRFDNFTKVNI